MVVELMSCLGNNILLWLEVSLSSTNSNLNTRSRDFMADVEKLSVKMSFLPGKIFFFSEMTAYDILFDYLLLKLLSKSSSFIKIINYSFLQLIRKKVQSKYFSSLFRSS